MSLVQNLADVRDFLATRIGPAQPRIVVILGSGLGGLVGEMFDAVKIVYRDIPGFPVSKVAGHAGELVIGRLAGVEIAALSGRAHLYEGWTAAEAVFPVRSLIYAGCNIVITTNAAGGIDPTLTAGQITAISDHISFLPSPLQGANEEKLGIRFPDMTDAYDPKLRAIAKSAAQKIGFALKEVVYAAMPGPAYETPAEVRMLRTLGANVVGMSTVPEVIAARHMGARVLGFSCVTNLAAGVSAHPLSHAEVTEAAAQAQPQFAGLIKRVVEEIATDGG